MSDKSGSGPSIEKVVSNAIGDSVTPSRLTRSENLHILDRLFGEETVDGPFHIYLDSDEQLHYLFSGSSMLSFLDDKDPFNDDLRESANHPVVEPAVTLVTSKRILFIYGNEDERRIIPVEYADINAIEYTSTIGIAKGIKLSSSDREFRYRLLRGADYVSELKEAIHLVSDKSDLDGEYQSYDFDSGDYSSARDALKNQLAQIKGLAENVDTEYVLNCAVNGATTGATRGGYAAGLGFMIGAGYGLWAGLSDRKGEGASPEDIDPKETAETMIRWQQAGKTVGGRKTKLASGAIGAALAIEKQTSGQEVTRILAEADVDWISNQLAAGESKEATLEIASKAVDTYAEDLVGILDEGFFEELEG